MSEDGPKIFIDEGWKAQVQREKEEAAKKLAAGTEPLAGESGQAEAPDGDMLEYDPEQPSFSSLVGSLATQAMFALGLIADQESGQVMVNLDAARYTLDLLAVLIEKTQGNLSGDEAKMLIQTTGELEQAFAVRVQQFQEQAMRQGGAGDLPPLL
ncbi:MAG: DUF1844 domain-containing protein [Candidatus Hydrogenedentes bacterium]|nr:DUF1844 domain-containing protein [Candidatus Hydrogenedentota bacterium]